MKFFLFLSLLTSMFTSCKENTVNPIVIKSDSEKSIMISIENNERIDLKNFIVNFTITNNTD
ncbi:MAG TPA: hypothetical protein PLX69_21625 [Leptospiraceae bacterium]|nr:hypothetical protein [Leptospiraceae bacterium]